MGLEALLAERPEPVRLCKVGRIVASLEDPYRTALIDLLAVTYVDGGESDGEISARLKSAGLPASGAHINRHRRGVCSCPPEGVVG